MAQVTLKERGRHADHDPVEVRPGARATETTPATNNTAAAASAM